MNRAKEALIVIPRNRCHIDEFEAGVVSGYTVELQNPHVNPASEEFVVELKFGTVFHANRAEYDKAVEYVKIQLIHHVYGDLINEIRSTLNAVQSGKRDAAMKHLFNMLDYCQGK